MLQLRMKTLKMKQTIAIDMDGVLADIETQFMDWYEKENGVRISSKNFLGVPESEAFPDKTAVARYITTPGFFRTLPVMEGAVETVKELMQQYDVYIVSAAMEFPLSLKEKQEWLNEHFPFISWHNIVFCGHKHIIGTDYLIDDHRKNLDTFTGKPIMFTAGHNVELNHHTRVNNWKEVLTLLKNDV